MIELKKIIDRFFKFTIKHCGKNPKNREYLLKSIIKALEEHNKEFISFNCRPKSSDKLIINKEVEERLNKKCAVILQGPILKEDDFTIETAKLYKSMYPEQYIIVSTWIDSDKDTLKKLKDLGIEIVLNEPPKTTGLGNINYQVFSTRGGINKAKELKCDYILKTRTDQRICMPNFLSYFLSLLDLYPLSNKESCLEKRLIVTSGIVGGIMFKPYMLSDFLFFGTSNDISRLFNIGEDSMNMTRKEREVFVNGLFNKTTVYDFYEKTAPESRIIKDFIDNYTDINADGSVKSYWDFVKRYLVTLSMRDIDLYWRKYNLYEESEFTKTYSRGDSETKNERYIWNFANWSMLYTGYFKYTEELEKYKNEIIRS